MCEKIRDILEAQTQRQEGTRKDWTNCPARIHIEVSQHIDPVGDHGDEVPESANRGAVCAASVPGDGIDDVFFGSDTYSN